MKTFKTIFALLVALLEVGLGRVSKMSMDHFTTDEREQEEHPGTLRQQMAALLEAREMTARDLSRVLGIREKEVYEQIDQSGKPTFDETASQKTHCKDSP